MLVKKSGALREINLVDGDPRIENPSQFRKRQAKWDLKTGGFVAMYGSTKAKKEAGHENKYDFFPPYKNDHALLFNDCLLVYYKDELNVLDLTINDWRKINRQLHGGYRRLRDDEPMSDEEHTDFKRTKEGYAKDGFVVSDDEEEMKE